MIGPRQLMAEHLAGQHAIIRHNGCPACIRADQAAPRGTSPHGRVHPELLRAWLAEPAPPTNGHTRGVAGWLRHLLGGRRWFPPGGGRRPPS